MASVTLPKGYPHYFAHFRIPVGRTKEGKIIWKQIKRSTGKERHDDAMVEAKRLERHELDAQGASTVISQEIMTILREAGKLAARGQMTLSLGRDLLAKIFELGTGETLQIETIDSWFATWLANKKGSCAPGTFARYEGIVSSFLDSLAPGKRERQLALISIADIQSFKNEELRSGKSTASVNLAIKTVRSVLKRAMVLGLIKVNPADAVETVNEDRIVKGTFSNDQVKQLLDHSSAEWKGAILVGYYTGARLGDVTNLKWANVNLEKEVLSFVAAKTSRAMELPLHPVVRDYLKEWRRKTTGDTVFPSFCGKTAAGRNGLSGQFAKIMSSAGITGNSVAPAGSGGRTRNTLSFHSLRHSFNSELANAGVSQEIRMKLTGHLDAKVNAVYTHTELDTLRKALNHIPSLSGNALEKASTSSRE
jgi:integrase